MRNHNNTLKCYMRRGRIYTAEKLSADTGLSIIEVYEILNIMCKNGIARRLKMNTTIIYTLY